MNMMNGGLVTVEGLLLELVARSPLPQYGWSADAIRHFHMIEAESVAKVLPALYLEHFLELRFGERKLSTTHALEALGIPQ